jgi:hypothetical protein
MNRLFRFLKNLFLWLGDKMGLSQYSQDRGSSVHLLNPDNTGVSAAPPDEKKQLELCNPFHSPVDVSTVGELFDRLYKTFEHDVKTQERQEFTLLHPDTPLFEIDFSKDSSLTEYQLIQLLTLVNSTKSYNIGRKNVFITDHTPYSGALRIALETHIAKYHKDSIQCDIPISQTTIQYFEINSIVIYLLKLFWILYDAIENPEQIKYPANENDITENGEGLQINIAKDSEQDSLLTRYLVHIKQQYDKDPTRFKAEDSRQECIYYYAKLQSVVAFFTKNEGNESETVLNKVKVILTFFATIMANQYKLLVRQDYANDSKGDKILGPDEADSLSSLTETSIREEISGRYSPDTTPSSSTSSTPPTSLGLFPVPAQPLPDNFRLDGPSAAKQQVEPGYFLTK